MKVMCFCKRTIKEIIREPISSILSLGFPIIMLVIMTIVNDSIPAQANMTVFQIQNLAPGIAYFGLTFIMLFACMQVAKDRSSALLMRMQASPMKGRDFILGYTLSVIIIALAQLVITFVASAIVGLIAGNSLPITGILVSIAALIPSAIMMISWGMIFGTILTDKAAPGICSILVSIVGMLGGIWMDLDGMGGIMLKISKFLPFYHGIKLARTALSADYSAAVKELPYVFGWMLGAYILAVIVMSIKIRQDVSK